MRLLEKIGRLPVGVLATSVGLVTLSNIYLLLGFPILKHLAMMVAILVRLAALLKITVHFRIFKSEYKEAVPASLYGTFSMLTMIIGSYLVNYEETIGKAFWYIGILLHLIHTVVFTYEHVVKGVNKDSFTPTWFVTYDGLLVSTVVGSAMGNQVLQEVICWYGLVMFIIIMPFMILRLLKRPIAEQLYHTTAILIAPGSLVIVSFLNVFAEPNPLILYGLYAVIFSSFIFILYNISKFFRFSFHPGFAGLTFPLAIGTVASTSFSNHLINHELEGLGVLIKQLSGIELFLATAVIAFVCYNFLRMLVRTYQSAQSV